jgi:putative toxin-antitoxin system antitoxin component (TIGR02293 family)
VVLLGLRSFEWTALMRSLERGFPYEAMDHLHRTSGLPYDELLEWVQVASRTLVRRKRQGRFSPEESDRLLRAARILGRALELFEGDRDAAIEWMRNAQPALGGTSPIEAARTELGAREVENLVGRLEHGVYS